MIIVETSVWIDVLRGTGSTSSATFHALRDDSHVAITDLIYFEILRGVGRNEPLEKIRAQLLGFPMLASSGQEVAEEAAAFSRYLRSRGVTIRSSIDCLVAACCILGRHELLHNDRDFDAFEKHLGLQVVRFR